MLWTREGQQAAAPISRPGDPVLRHTHHLLSGVLQMLAEGLLCENMGVLCCWHFKEASNLFNCPISSSASHGQIQKEFMQERCNTEWKLRGSLWIPFLAMSPNLWTPRFWEQRESRATAECLTGGEPTSPQLSGSPFLICLTHICIRAFGRR